MRKLFATLFVTALLLSPHSSIFQARADATARARGVIRAVDLAAGTVAIRTRNDDTVVLKTNETTRIERNGEPARLDDLQPGDRASALYDPASLLAAEIVARGEEVETLARVEGVISAVDTGASTLTILPVRDLAAPSAVAPPEVTLHVNANTAITLDGSPAKLRRNTRWAIALLVIGPPLIWFDWAFYDGVQVLPTILGINLILIAVRLLLMNVSHISDERARRERIAQALGDRPNL